MGYVVPADGHAVLAGHLGHPGGRAAPERAPTPCSTSSTSRRSRRRRRTTTCYATPNDEAKKFVDPEILNDPAVFPPEDVIAKLEGAKDTSGEQPADRHLGGVQVEDRRLTPTARRSGSAAMAVDAPAPRRRAGDGGRAGSARACSDRRSCCCRPALWYLVLLVAAAGDRRRLLVRDRGPRTAATRRASSSTTTSEPSRSRTRSSPACRWRSRARSAACSSACRSRTSSRPGPAAARACSSSCSSSRSGRASSSGPTPGSSSSAPDGGSPGCIGDAHRGRERSGSSAPRSRCCSGSSTAICR